MRKPTRTRPARKTGRILTASAFAALFAGFAFTGSASASTVLAGGCTGNVIGNMGDQVAVQGKDVAGLVKAGAQERAQVLSGVDPDRLAGEITEKGALVVGIVPDASTGPVTGENVGTVVRDALTGADGLGMWGDQQQQDTLTAIEKQVAGHCGMTMYAGNYTQAATLPTVPPAGTTVPAAPPAATAPPRDYGNIPAALPGYSLSPSDRYPASTPLGGAQPAPEVGTLGGNATGQTGVRTAGNANSLAAPDSASDVVRLPTLIAVVALAGVSAALVRTWVLRKLS